jgi:hypothetical protein
MKNRLFAIIFVFGFLSCNNEEKAREPEVENVPSSIDTTAHPTGTNEGAVISTDTASYNVENTNKDGREKLEKDKEEKKAGQ